MNTDNKTVREKAMYYWNQQISEFGQYTLTSTHYPDRHPLSLTGREIEKIYLSEHPEENEETKFSKHWWNGLNYRTRKELADAYTDNSGSVDAALMMDDETIERIYQSEHPKEQTKGVIEGMEDAAKKYLQQIDHETGGMWTEDDNEIAQHFVLFANTHYMPLLEIFREFLKVSEMYIDNVNNYPDFKMGKGSTITHYFNTVIEKANNYLKQ